MNAVVPGALLHDAPQLAAYLTENELPGARTASQIRALRTQRTQRRQHRLEPPALPERLTAWLLRQACAEIVRRGGQTVIHGKSDITELELWDRDPRQRVLLVGSRGYRHYPRAHGVRPASLAYLYGLDDTGPWAVRVPGTLSTVTEALAWLEPGEVARARERGKRVRRQGAVYAVETTSQYDGTGELPDGHRWKPDTRHLVHEPAHGRKHQPLRLPWPVRFVRQRTYTMNGRSTGHAG